MLSNLFFLISICSSFILYLTLCRKIHFPYTWTFPKTKGGKNWWSLHNLQWTHSIFSASST